MPASPMATKFLESERQLALTPHARSEILERMTEYEEPRLWGVARIGTDLGYYVVTQLGIHYAHREKAGLFKKREVSGFIDKANLHSVNLEAPRHLPNFAYLRFMSETGEQLETIWFEAEFCNGDAEGRAQEVADALAKE